MLNVTYGQAKDYFRRETRQAPVASLGVGALATMEECIRQAYEFLVDDYQWPHLIVDRDTTLVAGQNLYSFQADLPYDRIQSVNIKWCDLWQPVCYGIGPDEYNDTEDNRDPVERWMLRETQFEVWPKPESGLTLRMTGKKSVSALLNDADVLQIDHMVVVLYAAASWFAGEGDARSAEQKLSQAKARYSTLKAANTKLSSFKVGAGEGKQRPYPKYGKVIT